MNMDLLDKAEKRERRNFIANVVLVTANIVLVVAGALSAAAAWYAVLNPPTIAP